MKITFITLGGTIAKTYCFEKATILNQLPVIEDIVASLQTPDLDISFNHLMHKDSLDMTNEDREQALIKVIDAFKDTQAVILVQGTDTLAETGMLLHKELSQMKGPVVITGAMKPYVIQGSDGTQNITEALIAVRLLPPGVYSVMHNRVLSFPNVKKDYKNLTFTSNI